MIRTHTKVSVANLPHRLVVFLICLSVYSIIISIFYFKNPVKKIRYLSVHIRNHEESPFVPLFHPESHCNGCDRVRINAGDTKKISDIDFLVLIPSAPGNIELRRRIRNTWGAIPSKFGRRQIYFFIGLSNDAEVQKKLFRENSAFKDIIQPDFIDSFKNLTYKSLGMLYWVHYRLAGERFNPKFILKCDDDNLVNIFELENYMDTLDMYDDEIVCAVREEAVPARLFPDKKFLDAETWNEPLLPQCCFGAAYFVAPRAIAELIEAHESGNLPFIPYEDIYVTGILTKAANITLSQFPNSLFSESPDRDRTIMHGALSAFGGFELDVRWEMMQKDHYGVEKYKEIVAMREEEKIAKELQLKALRDLQSKQGLPVKNK